MSRGVRPVRQSRPCSGPSGRFNPSSSPSCSRIPSSSSCSAPELGRLHASHRGFRSLALNCLSSCPGIIHRPAPWSARPRASASYSGSLRPWAAAAASVPLREVGEAAVRGWMGSRACAPRCSGSPKGNWGTSPVVKLPRGAVFASVK